MFGNIFKKVKTKFLKSSLKAFFNKTGISTLEQDKYMDELVEFFSDGNANKHVIFSHPVLEFYEGTEKIKTLSIRTGSQSEALYYSPSKMNYINKSDYVTLGTITYIGVSSKTVAASSSSSGIFGGTGSNNNNNNNNNG